MKKYLSALILMPVLTYAQVSNLSAYQGELELKTNGVISINQKNHFSFKEGAIKLNGNRIVDINNKPIDTEIAQKFFSLNIPYLQKMFPAADILTSKTLFDAQFKQDRNSTFTLPYTPLKDWMGLSHPPVFSIGTDIEKYNERVILPEGKRVRSSSFHQKLDEKTDSELTIGNKLKLLMNKDIQTKKMKLLEESHQFFWGAVFLIRCDKYTMPFFNKMLEKQKDGLDVRLLIDRMGSAVGGGKCYRKLKRMGLNIKRVNKSLKTLWRETKGFRKRKATAFHPKFWINESSTGIVDGVNIMNIHIEATGYNHMYKDTGVLATGPIVTDLKSTYIDMWKRYIRKSDEYLMKADAQILATKDLETSQGLRGEAVYRESNVPNGACRVTWQDPLVGDYSTSIAMTEMIKASESYIAMTPLEYTLERNYKIKSTYTNFFQALDNKVRNEKVALDYIVNRHGTWTFGDEFNNDGKYQDHGKSILGNLINKKYKRWLQEKGYHKVTSYIQELKEANPSARGWFHYVFNHSKVLMVDNAMVAIGSHNMNDRSFLSDIETMLFCVDTNLAKELNAMLTTDMMNSISIPKK